MYNKPIANNILNGKSLLKFPIKSGKRQRYSFLPL